MSTFADAQNVAKSSTGPLRGSTGAPATVAPATNGGAGELAEDGYPKDMQIPVRYVKGMEGDVVEARRRWIATLKVPTYFAGSSWLLGTTGTQSAIDSILGLDIDRPLSVEAGAISDVRTHSPWSCAFVVIANEFLLSVRWCCCSERVET